MGAEYLIRFPNIAIRLILYHAANIQTFLISTNFAVKIRKGIQ